MSYLDLKLLMSVCGLTQLVARLGQVSVPFSQVFAGLVQLDLKVLQFGGLATNLSLVTAHAPLQL